jgi:hypothetical protein
MLDGQGLHQSESPMIAFIWNKPPFDLYEYKGMPIGLTNTPSVFMQAMYDIQCLLLCHYILMIF